MEDTHKSGSDRAHRRRACPFVATSYDGNPGQGERGVDIIDCGGGMVSLYDADLPRVIAFLAIHLAGEDVSF